MADEFGQNRQAKDGAARFILQYHLQSQLTKNSGHFLYLSSMKILPFRNGHEFLLFFFDFSMEEPSLTESRVPFPISLSTSRRPPIRSALSLIPSSPKCPPGANSVGLFGTVKPVPSSVTSSLISLSKVICRKACFALAWWMTLFNASWAIRYKASSSSLERRRSSPLN